MQLSGAIRRLFGSTASKGTRVPGRGLQRSFDGAGGGRRFGNHPTFGPINQEVLAALDRLRTRARYSTHNNPWLANGIAAWVTALVGAGIVPASLHPDRTIRRALQTYFAKWSRHCDADGNRPFNDLCGVAVRTMVESGECFIQLVPDARRGVALRLIDPAMVPISETRELGGGAQIVGGVEFNAAGQRVAYWICPSRPTDAFATTLPPVRIPAGEVLHLYRQLSPGQVRGIPWIAPVLLRLKEEDQLEDALLLRQQIAAMFAGFITGQGADITAPGADIFEGTQNGETLTAALEPGTLQALPPGTDVKFANPNDAAEGVGFLQLQLRGIAAGLGVPEFLMTGDMSNANYSSLRAALVEFYRRVETVQFNVIIPQFLQPVWARVITLAILSGAVDAADFEASADDYLSAEWYPPAPQWVDPLKDAEAEAVAIANGLISRRQAVAARGYDIEDLDDEISADRAREKALGLSFPFVATPKGTPDVGSA